eukprot:2355041-Prymnesium_polylepis.1
MHLKVAAVADEADVGAVVGRVGNERSDAGEALEPGDEAVERSSAKRASVPRPISRSCVICVLRSCWPDF